MDNLNEYERKVYDYIQRQKGRDDEQLKRLCEILNEFLKTISTLRTDNARLMRDHTTISELLAAKTTAYHACCQERVHMLSENKFLREKVEKLK